MSCDSMKSCVVKIGIMLFALEEGIFFFKIHVSVHVCCVSQAAQVGGGGVEGVMERDSVSHRTTWIFRNITFVYRTHEYTKGGGNESAVIFLTRWCNPVAASYFTSIHPHTFMYRCCSMVQCCVWSLCVSFLHISSSAFAWIYMTDG